jgi:phytoene dehydrogenase-like protein
LHGFGLLVVAGGAGRFVAAFRSLFGSLGARVETGFEVDRILVAHGRAAGVEAAGRTLRARRAVLASVTPGALYGRLLPEDAVDSALRVEAARFRHGRAALQIHVALSEPLGWRDPRLAEIPLIHLSDGSAGTGIACAEAGLLPRHPTVVVGQQYLLDPVRVPAGAAALWLQLQEVPYAPRGDAAGELDTTHGWTEALAEGYANRVLDRVARHAPDLRDKIRAIDVLTPDDLRDRNPNAVSGDPYGGSAELDQSFLWRPLASSGRHATPVGRLWHIGRFDPPGSGSRRRLRTSCRDHADQAQGVAMKQARGETIHRMGYAAGPGRFVAHCPVRGAGRGSPTRQSALHPFCIARTAQNASKREMGDSPGRSRAIGS